MARSAKRRQLDTGNTLTSNKDSGLALNKEGLKLLQLDLLTLTEQIRLLDDELKTDPCLTTDGIAVVLSLVDALKAELESARLRILELKAPANR